MLRLPQVFYIESKKEKWVYGNIIGVFKFMEILWILKTKEFLEIYRILFFPNYLTYDGMI